MDVHRNLNLYKKQGMETHYGDRGEIEGKFLHRDEGKGACPCYYGYSLLFLVVGHCCYWGAFALCNLPVKL